MATGSNDTNWPSTPNGGPDTGLDPGGAINTPFSNLPSTINVGSRMTPQNVNSAQFRTKLQTDPNVRRQFLIQLYNAHYYDQSVYTSGVMPNFDVIDNAAGRAIMAALSDADDNNMGLSEVVNRQALAHQNDVNGWAGGNKYTINLDDPASVRQAAEDIGTKLLGRKLSEDEKQKYANNLLGTEKSNQMSTINTKEGYAKRDYLLSTNQAGADGKGGLSPNQIAQAAYDEGFRGDALTKIVAIGLAESNGNPTAHNTNAGTGDNSYGIWQINMLGNMGPARQKQFGIQSNDQLFNPQVNAQAAFALSGGGKNLDPWTTYSNGKYKAYLGAAQAATSQIDGSSSANIFGNGPSGTVGASTNPQVASNYLPAEISTNNQVDTAARLQEQIRADHPVEAGAHDFANIYDMFTQILHGGR